MIRCNLSILLAERNLKISRVSNDTGLSRTTLTSLANNYSQGIQFDTINTLCNYLKVSPEKLISYIPVDISITSVYLSDYTLEIELEIFKNNKPFVCNLTGTCYPNFTNNKLDYLDIHIELLNEDDNKHIDELHQENLMLINAFNLLTIPFLNDIEHIIFEKIIDKFDNVADNVAFSFTFDNALITGSYNNK